MKTFKTVKKNQRSRSSPHLPLISLPSSSSALKTGQSQIRAILHPHPIQAKLTIGSPDDQYEQEADRVADRVMRMPDPKCHECPEERIQTKPLAEQITPWIQRQVEEEEEEEPVQTKAFPESLVQRQEEEEEEEPVQAKLIDQPFLQRQTEEEEEEEEPIQAKQDANRTSEVTPSIASQVQAIRGGGQSLPHSERAFFEPRFGRDFSGVHIHTDRKAAEAARAVNSRAFTTGRDVVFSEGQYSPGTTDGRRLLGHELTHVVQQSAGASPMLQRAITEDSIRTKNKKGELVGDFYSTHCGWVDTGHANPKRARDLIAFVREASQRIERREKALTKTLAAEPPGLVSETSCSASYDKGEQAESRTDAPVMSYKQHPSGAADIILGGFEVNGSDSAKFEGLFQAIVQIHALREMLTSKKFDLEVWGLSDCIGSDERNNKLRLARAAAISLALSGASKGMRVNVKMDHALTDYVASNLTREGRRKNRGVLIRLVPQVTPEKFGTPTMESRKWGVQVSAVTLRAELTRSLTEDEVRSVALTIFAAQSIAFEHLQAWRDVIPFAPPSSKFAEEDLPSNLIGFYRAARGFDIDEVRTFCGAWSVQRSVSKLKGYKFKPNPTFRAQRLPPGGAWPAELQTIVPTPFNSDVFKILQLRLQMTSLYGFNCSIDAKTNLIKCP